MKFQDYLESEHGLANGRATEFLQVRNGRLYLQAGHLPLLDLYQLAQSYGTPIEVEFMPLIAPKIHRLTAWFRAAERDIVGRPESRFIYAYATKANGTAWIVKETLQAGAHFEASSATDIHVAHLLWQQGLLPSDRLILGNGYKTPEYASVIKALRRGGYANVIPVLDSPGELELLANPPQPLKLGVRHRMKLGVRAWADLEAVDSRFGMTFPEIEAVAARVRETPDLELVLYHVHIGSQIEDFRRYLETMTVAVEGYCRLKKQVGSLAYLDLGGGIPVPYSLGVRFDYEQLARGLMTIIRDTCRKHDVALPIIVAECGRYTTADHAFHLFRVLGEKPGPDGLSWYIVDASIMVTLPDAWALGQDFVVLPLNGYGRPAKPVRLGGLTCDSDDVYPQRGKTQPLMLPALDGPLYVGFFMTGAYQENISGPGGAHHCLQPESRELTITFEDGEYRFVQRAEQSWSAIMELLGY